MQTDRVYRLTKKAYLKFLDVYLSFGTNVKNSNAGKLPL